jgi:hypothetical protein
VTRQLVVMAILLGGCGPSGDPLTIYYTYATSGDASCGAEASCDDITRSCDAVVMLRVVDPDNPAIQHYTECKDVPQHQPNLCPIATAGFDTTGRIPTDRVMVQMAVFDGDKLGRDDDTGLPNCPPDLEFGASQFALADPEANPIAPALSGRAFADGDDTEVTVLLGCHDISSLDTAVCRMEVDIDITASVVDFETQVSVSSGVATNLLVHTVEPQQSDTEWVIDTVSAEPLALRSVGASPFWIAEDVELGSMPDQLQLDTLACIQVLEQLPGRTASITCYEAPDPLPREIDLGGVRVADTTLDSVLFALGLAEFPSNCPADCGLLLGVVVDESGQGVGGAIVEDVAVVPDSEILYLSADRTTVSTTGPTSSHGIFIARRAPLFDENGNPNAWTVAPSPSILQLNSPVGGIVSNRLTVVVIRVATPP